MHKCAGKKGLGEKICLCYDNQNFFKLLKQKQMENYLNQNNKITRTNTDIITRSQLIGIFKKEELNDTERFFLGKDFIRYIYEPAGTINDLPKKNFLDHQFNKTVDDKEIMGYFKISTSKGLMSYEDIIWTGYDLASKQPNGKKGFLTTNDDWTIIGYKLCDDNIIRVACMCCRPLEIKQPKIWSFGCHNLNSWFVNHHIIIEKQPKIWIFGCYNLNSWLAGRHIIIDEQIIAEI